MAIYSIHERVKYFKTISSFHLQDKNSFVSGNIFESLANTNPELFDMYKLKQIQYSKNLVKDFNAYFNAILKKDVARFDDYIDALEQLKKNGEMPEESDDYILNNFNISYYAHLIQDLKLLSEELGPDIANKIITKNYFPESMSKRGIESLIRVRIANYQILVNGLTEMLKSNYDLLDIETAEAKAMLDKLNDDKHSHEAIGDIRAKLKDPKIVRKFKVGNNYDFRPIGGAYVVMGQNIDMEGGAPDKYLHQIFKYDCIVIAHGSFWPNERINSMLAAIFIRGDYIVLDILNLFEAMFKDEECMKVIPNDTKKILIEYYNELNKIKGKKLSSDELKKVNKDMKKMLNIMVDVCNDESIPWYDKDIIYKYMSSFDYFLQGIYSKYNIIQNKIDGDSSNWLIRPVCTLTKKNLTHVIDVIRALKKEGFKNIIIHTCNPGGVKLPIDIRASLDFTVTMGKHSVLKESVILQEGLFDDIRNSIKQINNHINSFISKYKKLYSDITKRTLDLILNRFKKYNKFDSPIKINLISINKNSNCIFEEFYCNDSTDIKRKIEDANKSIIELLDRINSDEKKYLSSIKISDETIFECVNII